MTKHTPGPWISYGYDITQPEGLYPIAKLNPNLDISEIEGNAALIAAAPDMLEALKHMISVAKGPDKAYTPDFMAALNAIEAAIAKAEGGS